MKPILTTERLNLIALAPGDQDWLHQAFTHPYVREFLWDDEIIPPERTKEILDINELSFEKDAWGLWKIMVRDEGAPAGFAGLWTFFGEPQPQLLYALLPQYAGKGYATEASQAIKAYAFNELKFSYLTAACNSPHIASKKVCERLGMKLVEEKEISGNSTCFYRLDRVVRDTHK